MEHLDEAQKFKDLYLESQAKLRKADAQIDWLNHIINQLTTRDDFGNPIINGKPYTSYDCLTSTGVLYQLLVAYVQDDLKEMTLYTVNKDKQVLMKEAFRLLSEGIAIGVVIKERKY